MKAAGLLGPIILTRFSNVDYSKYRIMDVLDIEVAQEDIKDLDSDVGNCWPEGGMSCPVPACGTLPYKKFDDLRIHWKLIHKPTVFTYFCSYCSFKNIRKNQLKRHYMRGHHLLSANAERASSESEAKLDRNVKYISPGKYEMPAEPREKLQRREEYREKMKEERRREVTNSGAGDILWRDVHINRDEEVAEHDGTLVVRGKRGPVLRTVGEGMDDSSADELDLM